jgi:hypothetical protein
MLVVMFFTSPQYNKFFNEVTGRKPVPAEKGKAYRRKKNLKARFKLILLKRSLLLKKKKILFQRILLLRKVKKM